MPLDVNYMLYTFKSNQFIKKNYWIHCTVVQYLQVLILFDYLPQHPIVKIPSLYCSWWEKELSWSSAWYSCSGWLEASKLDRSSSIFSFHELKSTTLKILQISTDSTKEISSGGRPIVTHVNSPDVYCPGIEILSMKVLTGKEIYFLLNILHTHNSQKGRNCVVTFSLNNWLADFTQLMRSHGNKMFSFPSFMNN